MFLRGECGCADDIVGCCRCAAEYTFQFTGGYELVRLGSEGFSWLDRLRNPQSCNLTESYRETVTYEIREVARCVNGQPTIDNSGSIYTKQAYGEINGVVYHNENTVLHDSDAAAAAGGGSAWARCYIPHRSFQNSNYRAFNATGNCCANSGSDYETEPLVVTLCIGAIRDTRGLDNPCVSSVRTVTSQFGGDSGCLGGNFFQNYSLLANGSVSNNAGCWDGHEGDISGIYNPAGLSSYTDTYTASATWTYHNDDACVVDPCTPVPSGACCGAFPYSFGHNNCLPATAGECARLNGNYRGDGTTCDTVSPPCPPLGACCRSTGGCTETTAFSCVASGGRFLGPNTDCRTSGCVPDLGACCIPQLGGLPLCRVVSRADCAGLLGAFKGIGTTCDDNTCITTTPTGACCINSQCSIQPFGACVSLGGTYRGDGTTCDNSPCGATGTCCCDPGTAHSQCLEHTTQEGCKQLGTACAWYPTSPRCFQIGCGPIRMPPVNPIDSIREPGLRGLI